MIDSITAGFTGWACGKPGEGATQVIGLEKQDEQEANAGASGCIHKLQPGLARAYG